MSRVLTGLSNLCQLRSCFVDESVRKKRKKFGGSGRKAFTEGWVEFQDKKIAKKVACSLNNTIIGW